jgi:hypothetical protein
VNFSFKEQQQLRQKHPRICREEIGPHVLEWDEPHFPSEIMPKL